MDVRRPTDSATYSNAKIPGPRQSKISTTRAALELRSTPGRVRGLPLGASRFVLGLQQIVRH